MKKPRANRKQPHASRQRRQTRAQRPSTSPADPTQGEGYLARLMAAVRAGGVVRAGEVATVTVSHDDGCKRPYGGPCTCCPDIEAVTDDGRLLSIDHDGAAVAVRKS